MSVSNFFLFKANTSPKRKNSRSLFLAACVLLSWSTGYCTDLTETYKLTALDGAYNDWFGYSVSTSGEYAIVGAYRGDSDLNDDTGAAYIFQRSGSESWSMLRKVLDPGGVKLDGFGTAVCIAGNSAIVGSPLASHTNTVARTGSAYIFTYPFTTAPVKLVASNGAANDFFGQSVSISGDYAIVGAPTTGSGPGAAYIFKRSESGWTQEQILLASDGTDGDLFGYSVAISGEFAIVGAPGYGGSDGAVYFFKRSPNGVWQQEPYTPYSKPLGYEGSRIGWSVAIDGNAAIVGWPEYNGDAGLKSGSAWIFKYTRVEDLELWIPSTDLEALDSAAGDQFGFSVSLSGHYAVVGSLKYMSGTGAAYVFRKEDEDINSSSNDWIQTDRLVASDTSPWWFGTAVALYDNRALVGAKGDNVNGPESGSVYSYNIFAAPQPPSVNFSPGIILLLLEE